MRRFVFNKKNTIVLPVAVCLLGCGVWQSVVSVVGPADDLWWVRQEKSKSTLEEYKKWREADISIVGRWKLGALFPSQWDRQRTDEYWQRVDKYQKDRQQRQQDFDDSIRSCLVWFRLRQLLRGILFVFGGLLVYQQWIDFSARSRAPTRDETL